LAHNGSRWSPARSGFRRAEHRCKKNAGLILQLDVRFSPAKLQMAAPNGDANLFIFRGLKPPAPSGILDLQL
jgi:hypothetical protein